MTILFVNRYNIINEVKSRLQSLDNSEAEKVEIDI